MNEYGPRNGIQINFKSPMAGFSRKLVVYKLNKLFWKL